MKLSPHFSLEELIVTKQKMDNTPSKEIIEVLRKTASEMEKVRVLLGSVAITVNSGYRSHDVNRAIGGSNNSAHTYGWAVDFTAYGHTPKTIATIISNSNLKFDQLIYEHTWVHISFDPRMRREVLSLASNGGYVKGII